MRVKYFCLYIFLLIFFSACSAAPKGTEQTGNASESPLPPMPEIIEPVQDPAAAESPSPSPIPILQEAPAYDEYHVAMEVLPETRKIHGIESITFTNRTGVPLSNVVIRTYLNAFNENTEFLPYFPEMEDRIFINGKDFGYMDILHVSLEKNELQFTLESTVLTVALPQPLAPGETTQLRLQFEAYVPKIASRTGANENSMWCGMFLPMLAAYGSDGWRTEPYYPAGDPFVSETANYTVEITTPQEYIVAGSGVQKEDVMDGKRVTTFSAKLARDFSFAVSDKYKVAEAITASGVSIQFYYYTESLKIDNILDAAVRSMAFFESYAGAYPYKNLCIIEADMFVSGMEFAKIVFLDSSRLQSTSTYRDLTHEIGHQWFYNVVGSDQIYEAWLDEGLTSYIQERFFYASDEDFYAFMDSQYKNFVVREGQVISNGVDRYKSWSSYYAVNYTKSKLMFYALNRLLGDINFRQVIQKYYQAYSFRVAKSADFIAIAEEVYGESLEDFFKEWLTRDDLPALP